MLNMQDLKAFFSSTHFIETVDEHTYTPFQWGGNIKCAVDDDFDWEDSDIIILGCGECRGADENTLYSHSPDAIRQELYKMYNWHPELRITDLGNILQGATVNDTRAALRTVLYELELAGKTVIILGGSHDLTLEQYKAYSKAGRMVNISVADMLIDLDEAEAVNAHSYLMDVLTEEPNFVRHYNHIGFQSYYTHPRMLETLDKLRFDFYRLGVAREHIEDMEPVLRAGNIFSFDMSAIRYSDAPTNVNGSPNGFTGEEACHLTRYAGMATEMNSFGIYGYEEKHDVNGMTAKLIAQMLWYFIDGYRVRMTEAALSETEEFSEFHIGFTDIDVVFLKSKRTNRWWMKLPNNNTVPCSFKDYQMACNNEIPERWLREQERLV